MAKGGGPKQSPSVLLNCLVGKFSFAILMRQYHERNIKQFEASKQHLLEQWMIGVEKIPQNAFPVGSFKMLFS